MAPRHRRRTPRIRARGLAVHMSAGKQRQPCVVEDISLGGLFVRTDWMLAPGTEVRIDMVRPGWKKSLALQARICSQRDPVKAHIAGSVPGMGIQFFGVGPIERDRLLNLLSDLGLPPERAESAEESDDEPPQEDLSVTDFEIQALKAEMDAFRIPRPVEALDPSPEVTFEEPRPPPRVPTPPPPRQATPTPIPAPPPLDGAKLMMQIQGLIFELSEARIIIGQRDLEIERLREQIEALKAQG